jgi:uncharacterized membrane protein YozB (DUF420 family)
MSSVGILEPAAAGRPGRGAKAALGLAMIGAVGFVILAALPYFTFLYSDAPNQFVDELRFGLYFPRRGWLLFHIAGGMLAVLAGPVQIWLGLSDRRMELHRKLGLTYITGVAVGAIGAVALAVQTPVGWVFGAGLLSLAAAWVTTTGLAFASIRRSHIDQHKEWMLRSYVVTFAFVTFRVGEIVMQGAGIGEPLQNLAFLAWASWTVPLLVTEAILQGKKIFA